MGTNRACGVTLGPVVLGVDVSGGTKGVSAASCLLLFMSPGSCWCREACWGLQPGAVGKL